MNVLWRGTFGQYLMEMWNPGFGDEKDWLIKTSTLYALRSYAVAYLRPGGPLPLLRVNKQPYIHYNKGSIVMYLIQDRLGEDRVNTVLRGLVDRYRFKPAPYARASDLVDGLLELARTPAERELILDQFYRITLYDLRAKQAVVRRLPDGQYETTITVAAAKSYADGKGNEKQAPFDEQVDVGVFTAMPGDLTFVRENVVSMQRLPIHSGEQQIRFVTQRKPLYAGVDPYLNFIDRNSNDNVVAVSAGGSQT